MYEKPLQIISLSSHDLYRKTLEALLKGEVVSSVLQKKSMGSAWGTRERPTRELRYVNLILENPLNRMINALTFNLTTAVPRTLLSTLLDEINLNVIQFYNPRAFEFSDDGKSIPTNYGNRIRHFNGYDQLQLVIDQLKEDPTTRRAVIHIHEAGDHVRRYTPCIDCLHFLIRNNTLECQALWRSKNALSLLPYNLFEFTMLQELIASELCVPVGRFVQTITSLHYYLEDQERVENIITELKEKPTPAPMDKMPFYSLEQIEHIKKLERELRIDCNGFSQKNELNEYWQHMFDVLKFYVFDKFQPFEKALSVIENSPWRETILEKATKVNQLVN